MATFSRAALTMLVMGAGGAGLSVYPTAALPQILNKADASRPILVRKLGRGHQFRVWGSTIIGGRLLRMRSAPTEVPSFTGCQLIRTAVTIPAAIMVLGTAAT